MTEFSLPYGKTQLMLELPDSFLVDVLIPDNVTPLEDPENAILQALEEPLGESSLEDFKNVNSVGIAINDKTRPLPKPNPLPFLLNYLETLGISNEIITLFIGSGTHTPMTTEEIREILGDEITNFYHIDVHECDQSPLVNLGTTSYGTPIQINESYFNCDLKMTVGNIEPHHFMGFSGGVKTAAIGLAGRDTITTNHAMLIQDQTRSGLFYTNPMRQDIEEIGEKVGIKFSLGTVLDEDKHLLRVLFGEPGLVMRTAIPEIRQGFGIDVSTEYDLVIASPGGAPKDINLYQAQKGLTHAARITKDGGWVILLAACPEGSGSQSYEDFMDKAESQQAILDTFKTGFFEVGPHKAYQIAKEAVRLKIIFVSDIPPEQVKRWKLTPSTPALIDQLLGWLFDQLPANARIAILPAASRTMTEVKHG